jgi:hypothetical protein
MARGQLMLDMEVTGMDVLAKDMDMVAVTTSMWTGNTPTMVSVLPTLTKYQMEIVPEFCSSVSDYFIEQIYIFSLMIGLTYNRHHL